MAEKKDDTKTVEAVNRTIAEWKDSRNGNENDAKNAWNAYEDGQDAARGQPKPSSPKP